MIGISAARCQMANEILIRRNGVRKCIAAVHTKAYIRTSYIDKIYFEVYSLFLAGLCCYKA